MKNVSINDKCNQCGICVVKCPQIFAEDESGNIKVLSSVTEETDELLTATKMCPVKAIELSDGRDKKESLESYIQKLEKYKGGITITQKDVEFGEAYTRKVFSPYMSCSGFDYRSSSKAQSAGYDEFRRVVFSQLNNIILERITDYRVTEVKPYYSKDCDSVYTKNNNEIADTLKAISIIVGADKLPSDFCTVDVYPDDHDIIWKMLEKGEIVGENYISIVKKEFDNDVSYYRVFIDFDDMEDYREKIVYCYDPSDARKEFEGDVESALRFAKSEIERVTVDYLKSLVNSYNKSLCECLDLKLEALKNI